MSATLFGAWLGGLAITAGLGFASPLYAGSGIVLVSLIVMVVAARQARAPTLQTDLNLVR